ncbi:MAG TPA: ABC transporter substrate-binding protein [Xanthobacteraceae bacterium]|nr:ABC transporter substrate-binding protein [Xanthobacteraceae bacterium]
MSAWRNRAVAAAVGAAATFGPTFAVGQEIDILMALPAATLTFSAPVIAEDAGFYKKEGLKVSHRTIVGVGAVNAVIAGSADFTIGTGPVFLRAAAQGQRLLAIANLIDKPLVELVLRKDVAQAAGVTDAMPFAARAKALRGKTVGIQGVNSIVHAWERLVANRGGLDVEKDVRIAPMDPSAMLAALETKAIDGYATSLPFTTEAVVKGSAVMLASAVSDAPDLLPFAYGLVYTRPDTCTKAREKCVRVGRALAAANRFIVDQPQDALALLKKRFDRMDPTVLAAAWQIVAAAHARDLRVTVPGLEHSQQVSLEAKLLEPKDALAKFDGLTTDEFVR